MAGMKVCRSAIQRARHPAAKRTGVTPAEPNLNALCPLQYGNDPNGAQMIRDSIVHAGGPLLDNVHLPKTGGVFDKLTDAALYTGSHKERFDAESGAGLGSAGRRGGENVADLSEITRPEHRGGTHLSSASAARRAGTATTTSPLKSTASSSFDGQSGRVGSASVDRQAPTSMSQSSPARSRPLAANASTTSSPARGPTPRVVIESEELHTIFMQYCAFGATSRMVDELDNARFAKLARETGLCDNARVTPAAVDLAFSRAKQKGKRTLSYDEFQQALAILAPQRHPEQDIVSALQSTVEAIIVAGGPAFKTAALPQTTGVFDKLTNPAYFTASHREKVEDRLVAAGVLAPKGESPAAVSPGGATR